MKTHANRARWLGSIGLAVSLTQACALPSSDDPSAPALEQQSDALLVHSDLTIGDFDRNGVVDAAVDGVAYLRSFGIRFNTYGVTDDTFNQGGSLPRRGGPQGDFQVFLIAEPCLAQFGVSAEVFPAEKVPKITAMVQNFLKMPQQYLRELGRQGYTIGFFQSIGRLAKYWIGSANGYTLQMFFSRVPGGGHAGKFRYVLTPGVWSDWEDLTNVAFNFGTGAVSFQRPGVAQTYTGTVAADNDGMSIGSAMNGTFTQVGDGNTYAWKMTSQYRAGGTTGPGGFGANTLCTVDGNNIIGHTGPMIQVTPSLIGPSPASTNGMEMVHEVGHVIKYMIQNRNLSFTDQDASILATTFPGRNTNLTPANLVGSGFVTWYAGNGGDDEDFADTWAYYVMQPSTLKARIEEDFAANGNLALNDKKSFIMNRVDSPDSAPFGFTLGTRTFSFATRNRLMFKDSASTTFPAIKELAGQSHLSLAGFGEPGGTELMFAVGTNNEIFFQRLTIMPISGSLSFSGWTTFSGDKTRLPVAAAWRPSVNGGIVVAAGMDDVLYMRGVTAAGVIGPKRSLGNQTTGRQFAVADVQNRTYVFATSSDNRIKYTTVQNGLGAPPAPWVEVPGGARVRDGVSASVSGNTITLTILRNNFQIQVSHLRYVPASNSYVFDSSWSLEPTGATVGTTPALSASKIWVKGFGDGGIYTKALGSTGGYTLIPGL